MTVDSLFNLIITWSKRIVMATFLVVLAITGVELLRFDVPGVSPLPLTQNVGVAIAAIAYFLKG